MSTALLEEWVWPSEVLLGQQKQTPCCAYLMSIQPPSLPADPDLFGAKIFPSYMTYNWFEPVHLSLATHTASFANKDGHVTQF